jgi:hypothetical protein
MAVFFALSSLSSASLLFKTLGTGVGIITFLYGVAYPLLFSNRPNSQIQ